MEKYNRAGGATLPEEMIRNQLINITPADTFARGQTEKGFATWTSIEVKEHMNESIKAAYIYVWY